MDSEVTEIDIWIDCKGRQRETITIDCVLKFEMDIDEEQKGNVECG